MVNLKSCGLGRLEIRLFGGIPAVCLLLLLRLGELKALAGARTPLPASGPGLVGLLG